MRALSCWTLRSRSSSSFCFLLRSSASRFSFCSFSFYSLYFLSSASFFWRSCSALSASSYLFCFSPFRSNAPKVITSNMAQRALPINFSCIYWLSLSFDCSSSSTNWPSSGLTYLWWWCLFICVVWTVDADDSPNYKINKTTIRSKTCLLGIIVAIFFLFITG